MRLHVSIARLHPAFSESGFTLIEVMVSALLVALLASATSTALVANAVSTADARHRSQAGQIADQDQQRLRGLSSEQLDGLSQSRVVTMDGTAYQVTSAASFLSSSNTTSCGAPGAGAAAYYRTVSTVNWSANKGTPVVQESIITPPAGGILLAQVVDQTGAGLAGVNVAATGASSESGSTDVNGCTELAALQPGPYTVSFADTGYVDPTGNPTPTSSATVTATGTSRPTNSPTTMGLAGTIDATFTALGTAGNLSNQQASAIAWFGDGTSSRMPGFDTYPSSCESNPGSCTTAASQLPATPSTVSLFPFEFTGPSYTGNYEVWAGPCQQMEPPPTVDKFTVSPGSNQTLSVQEPALDLLVGVLGVRVAPVNVKLTFQSTTGTACNVSWYPAITGNPLTNVDGVLASPGQPFATTATSGSTASASGLTGTYTVCASASVAGITRNVTISNITNNNFSSPTAVTLNLTAQSSFGSC